VTRHTHSHKVEKCHSVKLFFRAMEPGPETNKKQADETYSSESIENGNMQDQLASGSSSGSISSSDDKQEKATKQPQQKKQKLAEKKSSTLPEFGRESVKKTIIKSAGASSVYMERRVDTSKPNVLDAIVDDVMCYIDDLRDKIIEIHGTQKLVTTQTLYAALSASKIAKTK